MRAPCRSLEDGVVTTHERSGDFRKFSIFVHDHAGCTLAVLGTAVDADRVLPGIVVTPVRTLVGLRSVADDLVKLIRLGLFPS